MQEPPASILVTGSGTSTGVPVIGCACPVCTSADPRDARLRSGVLVRAGSFALQLDISPDFRQQPLRYRIGRVDALFVTHCHADHVLGLDDIRRYNTIQGSSIPLYARAETMRGVQRIFDYLVDAPPPAKGGLYRAQLDFRTVGDEPFPCGPFELRCIEVPHGPAVSGVLEVRLGARRFVYAPDVGRATPELREMLRGADVALVDGLRDRPHLSHLTFAEGAALLRETGVRRAFLTHIGHDVLHADVEARFAPDVRPAFDGLEIPF